MTHFGHHPWPGAPEIVAGSDVRVHNEWSLRRPHNGILTLGSLSRGKGLRARPSCGWDRGLNFYVDIHAELCCVTFVGDVSRFRPSQLRSTDLRGGLR